MASKEYFNGECSLIAPLTNVGGHVKALQFGAPFVVERWTLNRLIAVLMEARDLPHQEVLSDLDSSQTTNIKRGGIYRSEHVYVIVGTQKFEAKDIFELHKKTDQVSKRLEQKLSIVRLFYNGSMNIQGIYWSALDEPYEGNLSMTINENYTDRNVSHFTSWSVARVNDVLKNIKLPFQFSYLNLALEHLDGALRAGSVHMQFLALMIGLEVVFNLGPQDIRYRIARSGAVLLGEDGNESDEFFDWMRKLYDLRSKLVHTGASRDISKDDIWRARLLLRRSIVAAYQSGLDKAALMSALSRSGFGQWPKRAWYQTLPL